MSKAAAALLLFLAGIGSVAAETARIPLMPEPVRRVAGAAEFAFALPRHVTTQPGTEVTLVLRFGAPPQGLATSLPLLINDKPLRPTFSAETASLGLRLDAGVPAELLQEGWNRVVAVLPPQFATCEVRRAECYINFSFERTPLFPELRRFPDTMVEEALLAGPGPVVTLLVPAVRRDVHLRGAAIVGARFGQATYVREQDCEIVEIHNWASVENRNAVIVARWDELGSLPLVESLAEKLAALPPGRGMLAEFILGEFPRRRRWILATGSDDAGVEKALLTLGSRSALNALAPSPVEITEAPKLSAEEEARTKPRAGRIAFRDLGWRDIEVTRSPQHRSWRLPPSHVLERGEIHLNFFHSPAVANGVLEVTLGDRLVGSVPLTSRNAEAGSATLELPAGVRGGDPTMLSFRLTSTNSLPVSATVLGNSTLTTTINSSRISGLEHLDTLLVRDEYLRHIAIALPAESDLSRVRLLFDVALGLGRRLPSSPVLWPDACSFDASRSVPVQRLAGRSLVVLAPLDLWATAMPRGTRGYIEKISRDEVRIQGRTSRIANYEPALTLLQLIPAPWSAYEWVVSVGGWHDVDVPTVKSVFANAARDGQIYGNMAAVDRLGRSAAYDSRRAAMDSFPQRLQRNIPQGLNAEETIRQTASATARREHSIWINHFLFWFTGICIVAIVSGRLLLAWERNREYKKLTQQETL